MKNYNSILLLLLLQFIFFGCQADNEITETHNDNLINAYVPNAKTAEKIAEAVWLPIYGKKIYKQKPFVTILKNDSIWVVEGTLKGETLGGVAYIEILKKNGEILKVTHGK